MKRTKQSPLYITFITLAKLGLILFVLGAVSAIAVFFYFSKDLPNITKFDESQVVESTKIYDRTGKIVLYDIHGEEKRTVIPFDQIPQKVADATIAIEDETFFAHQGIALKSIIRSVLVNLLEGKSVQGGSTITQQLVKLTMLTSEKTITRKIKEWILAYRLEKVYSKEQILTAYLNQISYGSNAYGIEAASETFFGVEAKNLTIAQAALLASLPKAPSYYSPYGNHKSDLVARKNLVLDKMQDLGYITSDERDQAKKEEFTFKKSNETIKAPHFVMYVKDYLNEKYGEDVVAQAGLRVITTLDYDLQTSAEDVVRRAAESNSKKYNANNSALVAMDPKTGQILAMVGSKDYFDVAHDGNFNVATALRQPGSAFKPFAYAEAFAKGFTPDTVLFDTPTEFNPKCELGVEQVPPPVNDADKCYAPQDYSPMFRGPVTMRNAIAQSLNIPSVETLYLAGIENTIRLAESLGITTLKDRSRFGLSLVLGGGEVKLLEMVNAYSVFAEDGVKNPIASILRIEDKNGKVLEEFSPKPNLVLDPQTARLVSSVLSDNAARTPEFGATSSLYFPDYQVAAKTGTTQDYRDAWLVGYSPTVAVGFWSGNNDNTQFFAKSPSALVSGPWWHEFMGLMLKKFPKEDFTPPDSIVTDKQILTGNYVNETITKIDKASGKLATDLTPPSFIQEKKFQEVHSVLYWVDKNNPQGPKPADPSTDSQFKNWEEAVQKWLADPARKAEGLNLIQDLVPMEYDDIHTIQNKPSVSIQTPADGSHVSRDGTLTVSIAAGSKFKVTQSDFFLDDNLVGSKSFDLASFNYSLVGLESGMHTLKVKVYDEYLNFGEATATFTID